MEKKKDILPLKVPENSGTNMSVEQLLKEKVLEEHKLREMQKEEEAYQPTDDEVFVQIVLSHACSPEWTYCHCLVTADATPFSSVQAGDTVLDVLTSFVNNVQINKKQK